MSHEVTEEQLANVHPFAMWVVDQLDLRDGRPDDVFTDEDVLELAKGLENLLGDEELRLAVVSLLNLAASLQTNGSPKTARKLYDLVERPKVLDALKALNTTRGEQSEREKVEGQRRFEKMSGSGDKPKPAAVGEERPKDTVTLDKLQFPRRL